MPVFFANAFNAPRIPFPTAPGFALYAYHCASIARLRALAQAARGSRGPRCKGRAGSGRGSNLASRAAIVLMQAEERTHPGIVGSYAWERIQPSGPVCTVKLKARSPICPLGGRGWSDPWEQSLFLGNSVGAWDARPIQA